MTQLATLIGLMDSLVAGTVTTVVIRPAASGKGSVLLATSADCSVTVNASGLTLEGQTAPIAVDAKTLVGACKNRDVTLSVNGTEIIVKGGKSYSVNVACSDDVPQIEDINAKLEDATTGIELSPDNMQVLREGLSRTKIEKTYTGIVDTLVSIRADAKSITVLCYEPSQVASLVIKNDGNFPECFFVLPSGVFAKALNMAGNVKLTINETTAVFRSKASSVRVNLPIDTINAIDKDAVFQLVASTKDKNTEVGMTTTKAALAGFLNNAESLINVGGDVVISPSASNSIVASVTTVKGSIKEKFSGQAKKPFTLGFSFMRSIVQRSKDDIEVKTTDAFAVVRSGNATYIAALSET